MASITAIVYLAVTSHSGDSFTEFYILGTEGKAEGYPAKIGAGEAISVVLGIVNREQAKVNYRIEVAIDGAKNSEIGPISLNNGEKWEQTVKVTPTITGDHQKVEFLLYQEGQANANLSLKLWVDVK
jgi:uncharacterized membrane protein